VPLLRITCPAESTPIVVELLEIEAAATEVTVVVGASRTFVDGDVVLAEVPRGSIDEIVLLLRDTQGERVHHVTLQPSELLYPRDEDDTDDEAVIWAQVVHDVHEEGRLSWINLLLIVVASGIAAIGIIQDQLLLIVGAMALSPDYFPIVDTCLAIVRRAWRAAGEATLTLLASFTSAALGAWLLVEGLAAIDVITPDTVVPRELTLFISNPNLLSLVVALLAGIAGALALTLPDARGLVGVFVSITTIPAAANIGVAIASRDVGEAWGAFVMLAVNVLALILAGTITLGLRSRFGDVPANLRRLHPQGAHARQRRRRRLGSGHPLDRR
jgi:uncharacterized hydrophobic protein (TIGR00271 family)